MSKPCQEYDNCDRTVTELLKGLHSEIKAKLAAEVLRFFST